MADPFPTTEGGWKCILVDPPWHTQTWDGERTIPSRADGGDPYEAMSLSQLKALDVGGIAAKNSALFMWVIGSHLDQALDLGKSWGFTFKTDIFWWVKCKEGGWPEPGFGKWSRKQGEQVWLFTKGRPPRLSAGVNHIIFAPRSAHSAKPDKQYPLIEAVCGGPRLELFAERPRAGWTQWGRPTGRFDTPLLETGT